jgi:pimeloyl-ACP methyl ester carboxylesterase
VTWGVADYKRFVLAYLDDTHLARVAVIGHSFGGRIAIMLAADHPDRVGKMVLANSAGLRAPVTFKQAARNVAARSMRGVLGKLGLNRFKRACEHGYNRHYASQDYLNAGNLRKHSWMSSR